MDPEPVTFGAGQIDVWGEMQVCPFSTLALIFLSFP